MKKFEKIMVCVDRPERDEQMLDYVRAAAKVSSTTSVHLVHVTETGWGKEEEQGDPSEADLLAELESMGAERFGDIDGLQVSCKVITGSPLVEILEYSLDKELDLIVIGRHFGKSADRGDRALAARRLTMKAPCSVLVLPEDCELHISTVLVPVRDSEISSMALETACELAAISGAQVEALNVYEVSSGYSRVGLTQKEHAEKISSHARAELDRLVERTSTGDVEVQARCVPDFDGDPSDIILNRQASSGAKLVVIGARGRTGAAGVLLGSITEQLIKRCSVPVLAVKKKGETMSLIKALLELMQL